MNKLYDDDPIGVRYGISTLSIKDEWNLPQPQKDIRCSKMKMIDTLHYMRELAESLENRARRIPETDDPKHAALVMELEKKVKAANLALFEANMFGRG